MTYKCLHSVGFLCFKYTLNIWVLPPVWIHVKMCKNNPLTIVSPGCIPARIASICVWVNWIVLLETRVNKKLVKNTDEQHLVKPQTTMIRGLNASSISAPVLPIFSCLHPSPLGGWVGVGVHLSVCGKTKNQKRQDWPS